MARDPGRTLQTARQFPIGVSNRTLGDRLSSTDLTDIWRFRTTSRSSLSLTLNGLARRADADVALLNDRGAVIQSGARRGNRPERLAGLLLEPGTYYVRVQRQRGSLDTRYALTMAARPTDDRFGNSFDAATPLPPIPQGAQRGSISDFVGDRDRDDYLSFGTLVAGAINLELTGLSENANVEIYNGDRKLLIASRNTGNLNDQLNQRLTDIAGSIYFLRVTAPPGQNTTYTLNYSFNFDTPTQTASGLRYIDLNPGTGATPQTGQTLRVNYTGLLTNGRKFDSSRDPGRQPFSFVIGRNQVIAGWEEGLRSMRVGGRRQLIIPPSLGYGSRGTGNIPPNATLIFDVELLSIN